VKVRAGMWYIAGRSERIMGGWYSVVLDALCFWCMPVQGWLNASFGCSRETRFER